MFSNTLGPEAVIDFTVETTERSALLLANPPDVTNGIVIYFQVSYDIVGSGNDMEMNFSVTNNMQLNDQIRNLLPFTQYTFSVKACTITGCGPPSVNIMRSTLEDG